MKKLRLHVEELKVESFPTAPAAGERGTVRAHAEAGTLLPPSCPVACETYDDTVCGLTWHCVTDDC
jgi:hypothetical protein